MLNILEKLRTKKRDDKLREQSSWQEFVADVSAEKTDLGEVEAGLAQFAKTADELEAAVSDFRKLAAARELIRGESAVLQELAEIDQELKLAEQTLTEQRKSIEVGYRAEMLELTGRANQLVARQNEIQNARSMVLGMPKPVELQAKIGSLQSEVKRHAADIRSRRDDFGSARNNGSLTAGRRKELDAAIDAAEAAIRRCNSEIQSLETAWVSGS